MKYQDYIRIEYNMITIDTPQHLYSRPVIGLTVAKPHLSADPQSLVLQTAPGTPHERYCWHDLTNVDLDCREACKIGLQIS